MGVARAVDLRVEHLVLEVCGSLRLEVDVRSTGLDDLVIHARSRGGSDLKRTRVSQVRCGRCDAQARAIGCLRSRGEGLHDLGGRFGQYQHPCHLSFSSTGPSTPYLLGRRLNPASSSARGREVWSTLCDLLPDRPARTAMWSRGGTGASSRSTRRRCPANSACCTSPPWTS